MLRDVNASCLAFEGAEHIPAARLQVLDTMARERREGLPHAEVLCWVVHGQRVGDGEAAASTDKFGKHVG